MAKNDTDLQKLTLTVPADVVERAKLAAVRRKTSISKEVTEFLRKFGESEATKNNTPSVSHE